MADRYLIFIPLLEAMAAGHLVLTPNHRTHVQLLDFYGQWRKDQGLPLICSTPEIYPVDIWIRSQWQQMVPASEDQTLQILEPVLEASVWQDLIQQSEFGANLVNKSSTARTVQEAWRLIHIWKIGFDDIRKQNHFQKSANNLDDLAAFLSWVESFEKFCQLKSVISLSPLVTKIIEKIVVGQIHIPEQIYLTGFQSPPPLYADLIDALVEKSDSVHHFKHSVFTPNVINKPCLNSDDEVSQAAQWAKTVLAESPEAKIGIICQQLKQREPSLQRVFNDVFNQDSLFFEANAKSSAIHISLSRPLQETPIIESALGILELNNTWLDTLSFCKLIRSPFLLNGEEDDLAKPALEFSLRRKGELKIQLALIREILGHENKPEYSEKISSALLELDSLRRKAPSRASCDQWSDIFETQLQTMGWPGTRQLDHAEVAQLYSWSKALRLFKQTSHWHGVISIDLALAQLKQIVASFTVAPTDDSSAIQIITPTEADGLVFTHTWVMGLSEQHWPPASRPSPFIPLSFQKKARMPESDIGLQTIYARQQLQQFRDNCSAQIIYSYPCQDDDLALKPAAMLKALAGSPSSTNLSDSGPLLHPAAIAMMKTRAEAEVQGGDLELFRDKNLIPLAAEENSHGGISLIANQADCPFKAFAIHRLDATQFPAPVIGLSANVLGSLLHEVMESFWKTMQSQQHLLDCSEMELETIVTKSVNQAIQNKARYYRYTMTERFIALETRRLSALLMTWLEEEKKRGAFKVLDSESRLQWKHADLVLNMRLDRLDEASDGSLVVIDYKSGKSSEIKWLDERQSDPQLMLYMLAVEADRDQTVDGLFIAQINVEESRYKGISNNDSIYPKSQFSNKTNIPDETSWENLRKAWQESLASVANQYLQGFAAVDPKNVSASCTWCHLGGLCRIKEEVQA